MKCIPVFANLPARVLVGFVLCLGMGPDGMGRRRRARCPWEVPPTHIWSLEDSDLGVLLRRFEKRGFLACGPTGARCCIPSMKSNPL